MLYRLLFHPEPQTRELSRARRVATRTPRLQPWGRFSRPAPSLSRSLRGLHFPAPVMVGAELPGNERALAALSRFGVGAVEVGPVALAGSAEPPVVERRAEQGPVLLRGERSIPVAAVEAQLVRVGAVPARVAVRLAHQPAASAEEAAAERATLIRQLAPLAELFTLEAPPSAWDDADWAAHLAAV